MPPVVIPRPAVAVLYGIFAALGVVAVIIGIPTFDLAAPAGWTPIWGGLLAIASLEAVLGLMRRMPQVERWSLVVVSLLLFCYLAAALYLIAIGENPQGRGAFAVVLMVMMWFPVVRLMSLRDSRAKR